MKYLLIALFSLEFLACQGNTQNKVELKTQIDSVSYTIGMDIGENLKKQKIEVVPEILAKGIRDILDSNQTLLTEEQAAEVISTLQQKLMSEHQEMVNMQKEKNKKASDEFLAENKKKTGVISLPSGLQYKVIKMGTGPKPKATDKVTVHYKGTLIDGTEFDNSYTRGEPATFNVNQVIKGWTEALQLMPVGSKWIIYLPPDLAYGEQGAGDVIEPNSTLIFEVELIKIN